MNNVALITGASTGIGYELAKVHAKNNKDLIIVSRNIDDLNKIKEEFEKEYNIQVVCINKDLSIPNASIELYNQIKELNIEVEYLINNAGVGFQGYFNDNDLEKYTSSINLNIIALTELTKLFVKDFLINNKGKILNVSSIAAYQAGPMLSVYSATKAYVTSFSNAVATELYKSNVTITTLHPGVTNTPFVSKGNFENVKIFKRTKHPSVVAIKGYKAMMKGKLNVEAAVSFKCKLLLISAKFVPKKIALRITMYLQK
ncbi:MAG: SDR family NAD(P)-dependent oxidoreductase [bacterium]